MDACPNLIMQMACESHTEIIMDPLVCVARVVVSSLVSVVALVVDRGEVAVAVVVRSLTGDNSGAAFRKLNMDSPLRSKLL